MEGLGQDPFYIVRQEIQDTVRHSWILEQVDCIQLAAGRDGRVTARQRR
jgi:hypothetical protein